jgi:hypothetical protein
LSAQQPKPIYKAPIGIPEPEFGINQSVESIYGSADYYTHYIDNTHPDATDENNEKGSAERPRKSMPGALTLEAGSVVIVKGGPYKMDPKTIWKADGNLKKPVFIRGLDPDRKPRIINCHLQLDGKYFIIENIEFYDDSYIHTRKTAQYISVRDCEIHNPPGKIIDYGAAVSAEGENIVVYKNNIHHHVTFEYKRGGDCHGVRPGVGAKRVWVLENEIHHNSGDAVQACHYCDPRPQYIFIGKNVMYADRENAVDLKYASDIIVSQNKMYGYGNATTSDGSAVVLGSDGMPNRSWVIFNEIYDSANGIRNENTDCAWIIGNKIYNIGGFAISLEKKSDDMYIVANTIYDVDIAIEQLKEDREAFRVHVYNNIFANIRGKKRGSQVYIPSNTIANASAFSNNLFWQNGDPVVLRWGSENVYKSTADFREFSGGTDNIIEDPLFLNAKDFDFNLNQNSPAINIGFAHHVYETFFSLYGIDIKVDYNRKFCPQKLKWDIGAFEYSD